MEYSRIQIPSLLALGNGALGAKPGSETLDCASPISVFPRRPPALPPPPLDPATSNKPPPPSLRSLFHHPFHTIRPRYYIAGEVSLSTRRREESKFSLRLGTNFKLDTTTKHNGALLGKYDSVISYSLCRNRLRRTICGCGVCCLSIERTFPEGKMIPK